MLSKNLIRLRKRAGMTQKDVAERLHISPQAYARYERTDEKRNEPNSENISKLADMFNVTTDELLGRTPKDSSDDFDAFMFEDKEAFDSLPEDVKKELKREINEKIEFLKYKQNKDK